MDRFNSIISSPILTISPALGDSIEVYSAYWDVQNASQPVALNSDYWHVRVITHGIQPEYRRLPTVYCHYRLSDVQAWTYTGCRVICLCSQNHAHRQSTTLLTLLVCETSWRMDRCLHSLHCACRTRNVNIVRNFNAQYSIHFSIAVNIHNLHTNTRRFLQERL